MSRGLNLVCHLGVLNLVSQKLTAHEFGLWMILTGWLTFATALDFGLGNSIQGLLAVYSARKNGDLFSRTYIAAEKTLLLIGTFLGAIALTVFLVSKIDKIGGVAVDVSALKTSIFLAAISTPILYLSAMSQRALLASAKYSPYNLAVSAGALTQLIYVFVLNQTTENYSYYIIGPALAGLTSHFVARMHVPLRKTVPGRPIGEIIKLLSDTRQDAAPFAIIQLMAQSLVFLPTVIVSACGGLEDAGLFGGILRLSSILIQGASIVSLPLRTDFTHAIEAGRTAVAKNLLKKISFALLISYFAALLFLFVLRNILSPLMISGLLTKISPWTWFWLGLYICAQAIGQPLAAFLNGIRAIRGQALYGSVSVFTTFALIPLLQDNYGVAGSIAALGIPLILINLPLAVIQIKYTIR